MFVQAIQIKSPLNPALLKHEAKLRSALCSGSGNHQNYFNSRNLCCFKNVVIISEDANDFKVDFKIMPHIDCTIEPNSALLVYKKERKWYCCN